MVRPLLSGLLDDHGFAEHFVDRAPTRSRRSRIAVTRAGDLVHQLLAEPDADLPDATGRDRDDHTGRSAPTRSPARTSVLACWLNRTRAKRVDRAAEDHAADRTRRSRQARARGRSRSRPRRIRRRSVTNTAITRLLKNPGPPASKSWSASKKSNSPPNTSAVIRNRKPTAQIARKTVNAESWWQEIHGVREAGSSPL